MATKIVKTAFELTKALSTAVTGDNIKLAAGVYDNINIQSFQTAKNVTISSLNPNDQAVINNLFVKNSDSLLFSDIKLTALASARDFNFQVVGSSDINFKGVTVTGAGYEHSPFKISESRNVSMTNSEFVHSFNALSLRNNIDTEISSNLFHDIRSDGVHGSLRSGLEISNNVFTDFHPRGQIGGTGDHADAIQLWTDNTSWIPTDISIINNVFDRGQGDKVQGIWLRDNSGKQPFTDVTISSNTIVGGMYNGIGVYGAKNLLLDNNVVAGYKDQMSWIKLKDVDGATMIRNKAAFFAYEGVTRLSNDGGTIIPLGSQQNYINSTVLSTHLLSKLQSLVDFDYKNSHASSPGQIDPGAGQPSTPVTISGTAGNDVLKSGKDAAPVDLNGGAGSDTYHVSHASANVIELAGGGQDRVYSTVSYTLSANVEELFLTSADTIGTGNGLANRLVGSTGDETLYGLGGNDALSGGSGNDTLWGGEGADDLRGDAGNDLLYGGLGNDVLRGGDGDDLLFGNAGSDTLESGSGNDLLYGGTGSDIFLFRVGDLSAKEVKTIGDFNRTEKDHLNLTLIDADISTSKNDGFKFIGNTEFTHKAGELNFEVINGDTMVHGDTNGDGVADFTIKLVGISGIKAADIWL